MPYKRLMTAILALLMLVLLQPDGAALAQDSTGITSRESVATSGAQGNSDSRRSAISWDGRYVAFDSWASNLVGGDTNGVSDVFVRDRETQQTWRVSVATGGGQSDGVSGYPSVSADGRYVAFASYATNLVSGDGNGRQDVFVHDRQTGQTSRVSVATGGGQGDGDSSFPFITADGRYVAFTSSATNLVPGDTNGTRDVFMRDRQTGQTWRMSVGSGGSQSNGASGPPSVSSDGRYVAFASDATNLAGSDTNGWVDVFVHDRWGNSTTRVSVSSSGAQGLGSSDSPSISADGRYVAYVSTAYNLVSNDTNGARDVFVRDRAQGQTWRMSVASDGRQANADSNDVAISADGRHVAFTSLATNLVDVDTFATSDVFVNDLDTGLTERVSVGSGGLQADGDSDFVAISGDGRYVSFESTAGNLVPSDINGVQDVFVHDRAAVTSIFADVPVEGKEWMQPWIETFYDAGITSGCDVDPLRYCPEREVTRAEMAVFLLRAKHYPFLPYDPVDQSGSFSDMPVEGKEWMEEWVEELYALNITTGCADNPLRFCPERPVTRAEMAVFVLRALHGGLYQPPAASGTFADVPVTGKEWMEPWIEEFYDAGITTGCGVNAQNQLIYCPERPVTRAETAVFILRAFDQKLPTP